MGVYYRDKWWVHRCTVIDMVPKAYKKKIIMAIKLKTDDSRANGLILPTVTIKMYFLLT